MEDRPETRRRARLFGTPAGFVVAILAFAGILALVLVLVYVLGGLGEGAETLAR